MSFRTLLVTAALVFLVGATARAAELFSASMFAVFPRGIECRIVNTSAVAQTVRIRAYDANGGLLVDSGNYILQARRTAFMTVVGSAHCRFTTVSAKTLFRASIDVFDYTTNQMVSGLPAQ